MTVDIHEATRARASGSGSVKILAFAYACEPDRGSEPGAGWAWARMLAGIGETWVITRADYRAAIEAEMERTPERDRLKFVYVELPEKYRRWQRDLRGLRIYYLLWQLAALKTARRIARSESFDLTWHLTWASAWIGTLSAYAGRPFIYGPVGGCVGTIPRLLPHFGLRGAVYEILRGASHAAGRYLNPLARASWRKADLILVQNDETRAWLPARHRDKARIFPNAVVREEITPARARPGPPTILYAGRLEGFKGVYFVLRALKMLPAWRLIVCGSGSDEARLRRLASRFGVADRIEWFGWLPREELLRMMRSRAHVLMLPSIHEEAGAVILEAMAAGLPVVAFDRGGPPLLGRDGGVFVSARGAPRAIARRLAEAAIRCLESNLTPPPAAVERFSAESRARDLAAVVADVTAGAQASA